MHPQNVHVLDSLMRPKHLAPLNFPRQWQRLLCEEVM